MKLAGHVKRQIITKLQVSHMGSQISESGRGRATTTFVDAQLQDAGLDKVEELEKCMQTEIGDVCW